ncbi:MAG: serine/threonine-protein kinase [Candidatus Obscuribacterales bacterium]|nr:serine/threonine-protein kinase [Candidatus Obscuribacterales bacterium]
MSTPPEELSRNNALTEGQVFEGRYQILSVLGRGGVGVVYKARHMHMDKMVAIKTLLQSVVSDDAESFQRFEREARTASSLDHVNIIKIFDFGKTASGLVFLVMEYLGDQTLESLLLEKGRLDIDRFLSISVQICDGLQNAHKHQVIHRDIKPSNIMLLKAEDNEECVKIVDFGLAKLSTPEAAQSVTRTGTIIGTPLFMSPEQCRGLTLDNRSDIYSLGCVFYLMLTGRVPIQGATTLDTLFQHTALRPVSFAALGADLHLPPRLEQVIFKALEKDPDQRQQSMLQLRTEIQQAIFDPSFRASTVPPASGVSSAFAARVVSAEDSSSAQYADLLDSANTMVSINKTPESIKQLRGTESEKSSKINKPVVVATLAVMVLIAVAAVVLRKPAPVPIVAATSAVATAPTISAITSAPTPSRPKTVTSDRSKFVVKEQKARPEKKQSAPVVAKRPNESKVTPKQSNTQTDLQQIESLQSQARSNVLRKNWSAALTAFDSCLRLEAKVFGAQNFRLFPTLANIMHCQLMLNQANQTRNNLMLALGIFSGQRSAVLENVSKRPQATRIWRTLASVCLVNGAPSHDPVLLNWSADFYELTRKSWHGDTTTADYVQLCQEYSQVLELCGNREKENQIRAEINLPPLPKLGPPAGAQKRGRPQESVKRNGRMVIRSYRY